MEDREDKGVAITLGVLALSGMVLVGGYMRTVSLEKGLLEKQMVLLAERVTASKAARGQVEDAFEQREAQLKQVSATEAQYAGLLTDLLELSKIDPDARLVVQKWKIQAGGVDSQSTKTSGEPEDVASPPPAGRAKPGP